MQYLHLGVTIGSPSRTVTDESPRRTVGLRPGEVVPCTHPAILRISITYFLTLMRAVAVQAIKGVPTGTNAHSVQESQTKSSS